MPKFLKNFGISRHSGSGRNIQNLRMTENYKVKRNNDTTNRNRELGRFFGARKDLFFLEVGNPEFCFHHTAFGERTGHVGRMPQA